MSETERDGLNVLAWFQKNAFALGSVVFALGIAYSQLSHLGDRLQATALEIKELRREMVELRVNGLGLPRETHNAFVDHQEAVDDRQDRELEFLRDSLIKLRLDVQRFLMKKEPNQ